jgi:uncharacterized protein (TIGR02996 family)
VLLEHAFLEDIVEHPADDAPRLVYADWLDDHGRPERAEFIRLQCRRARLPADHPEQEQLAAREADLMTRYETSWRAGLPELEGVTWEDFSRGFVEAASLASAEAFLLQGQAVFEAAPVCRVRLGQINPAGARELAKSPYLGRLTELNLGNNSGLDLEGMRALASSPHLGRLTSLLLHYNPLGDDVVSLLVRTGWLGQLRELYLSGVELGDAGLHALASAGRLPQLTDLDLRDNQISDAGARSLAYNVGLGRLETLWLVNNRIGEAGAEALAWTEQLPRLERLYLNYNPTGDAGAAAFASSPHRGALVELDLRHCGIRDAGGRALAGSSLESVRLLWLGGNRMRTETLTLLRWRFGDRLRI